MLQKTKALLERAQAEKDDWFRRAMGAGESPTAGGDKGSNLVHDSLEDLTKTVKRMMFAVSDGSAFSPEVCVVCRGRCPQVYVHTRSRCRRGINCWAAVVAVDSYHDLCLASAIAVVAVVAVDGDVGTRVCCVFTVCSLCVCRRTATWMPWATARCTATRTA